MKEDKKLEYLEEERKKLWSKLLAVEEAVNKKPSDIEREAMQAQRKTSEYRNKAEEAKELAQKYSEEALQKLGSINATAETLAELYKKIETLDNQSKENLKLFLEAKELLESRQESIDTTITEIETVYEDLESYELKIKKLETTFQSGNEYFAKIETLNKSILARKSQIDELYFEIIGYEEKDDQGNIIQVPGLKEELEKSYDLLKSDLSKSEKELKDFKNKVESDYTEFSEKRGEVFNTAMESWKTEYSSVLKQIEDLLPNALTAGLSYAYSKKKDEEIKECEKISITFNNAIKGLVGISLIPFAISIYSLFTNVELNEVINRMPRAVLSILPLYIPVMWVAYSANRKMNLSKRLSEEYAHKEVLSKTFEGLSKQINNIDNKDVSTDLRNKLLYNILEVSSENPGKLISDYNKSDHPLMDALDKSVKLADAVEKLAKIPGFKKLANSMDKKAKIILDEKDKKATAGLKTIENDEEEDSE